MYILYTEPPPKGGQSPSTALGVETVARLAVIITVVCDL